MSRNICVDVDGTLLRTDLLYEAVAVLLKRNPFAIISLLLCLFKGKAVFKRLVADRTASHLDIDTLPANKDFVEYLDARSKDGDRIFLASASDELLVERVAERFSWVEGHWGSDGQVNLSGAAKSKRLSAEFPDGYVYAGDSSADVPVWQNASAAIIVNAREAVANRARSVAVVEREFASEIRTGREVLRALRLRQWAKNSLIFVPAFLSGQIAQPQNILFLAACFVLFGVVASATYLANDLLDLAADRRHHRKRNRPFASGALPLKFGYIAVPTLIVTALAIAFFLSPAFAAILTGYLGLTVTYSLWLKSHAIVDVITLAWLHTIRLIAGAVVVSGDLTPWLLIFSLSFFGSLAFIKRYTEAKRIAGAGKTMLHGRDYTANDTEFLGIFGIGLAIASIIIFNLYLIEDAFSSVRYTHPIWLWAAPGLLTVWLMRAWLITIRGDMRDDPVLFALKDKVSLALIFGVAISFLLAV